MQNTPGSQAALSLFAYTFSLFISFLFTLANFELIYFVITGFPFSSNRGVNPPANPFAMKR